MENEIAKFPNLDTILDALKKMTKNTWIVTTGSSDILLQSDRNWSDLKDKARRTMGRCPKDDPKPRTMLSLEDNTSKKYFTVPSRSLGRIYGTAEEVFDDLIFPLWDCFLSFLEQENINLNRIVVLLTDQKEIFPEKKQTSDSPLWKDTIECQPLFERYLERHNWSKNIKPEFLIIAPTEQGKGIDHWDGILELVQKTLTEIECEEEEKIYVSHQAGTPAVSSALQFVSLARFGSAVKFLVTNEYNAKNTKPIEGSKYLHALQLQKAKKLIIDGIPGAALELLRGIVDDDIEKELQKYVDIFNIKATVLATGVTPNEFKPKNAGERIRRALDLVDIFFKQGNYLSGITLLIAAQETFLKAAIIELVSKIAPVDGLKPSQLLQWDKEGLSFKSQKKLARMRGFDSFKNSSENLCKFLHFSIDDRKSKFLKNYLDKNDINSKDFCLQNICNKAENSAHYYFKIEQNSQLLAWLKTLISVQLNKDDWTWKLLNWSYKYNREREGDRRNQLVHNLRGVDKIDVLCYFCGYEKEREEVEKLAEITTVKDVYLEEIKKPFVRILSDVGLCNSDDPRNLLAEQLKTLSDRIQ